MTINEADGEQSNLLNNILEFNDKARSKSKEEKKDAHESVNALYEGR